MTRNADESGPSWPGWVAAILAIAANAWVFRLEFAADDFAFLTRIPERFVPEPWITDDPCSGAALWYREATVPVPGRYIFRPAVFALWWALAHAGGGAVSSAVFHGVGLLAHAAAALLLFRVLRPGTGAFAAGAGAMAFAIAPGSIQAVAWVSATGDVLGVVFVLISALAVQRGRRTGSLAADVIAGLAFALAVASKESSLYLGPAVLLAGFLVPRGERPSPLWRLALVFAAPLAAFVVARHAYVGTWGPPWNSFSMPWRGKPEIEFLAQYLAPWDEIGPVPWPVRAFRAVTSSGTRTAIRIAGAAVALLPLAAGLVASPRRVLPRAVAVVIALAIGLIPISRFFLKEFDGLQSNGIARAAYPVSAFLAALVAFGLDGVRGAARGLLFAPLLIWQAAFLIPVAQSELAASADTRLRRSSLGAIVARSQPGTWFVAVEGGAPGVVHNAFFIEDAFRKPFVESPVPVTWVPRDATDVWERVPRCVFEHRGPVQVVTYDAATGYVVKAAPVARLQRPEPDPDLTAAEIAIVTPPPFSEYDRKMPPIAWRPAPAATRYVVSLELRVRGQSHVAKAEIDATAPRVDFEPGLMVTFERNVIPWRVAQSAIDSLPHGPGSTIQCEIRVAGYDSAGRVTALSEWRSIYLEPEYR